MTGDWGDQADDGRSTTRVPKYQHGDAVVAWSEVDTEWWKQIQHARAVQEKVVATYIAEPGVESIERGCGTETIAGLATTVINVLVADAATAERLAPPRRD